jgi:hypothetical protein
MTVTQTLKKAAPYVGIAVSFGFVAAIIGGAFNPASAPAEQQQVQAETSVRMVPASPSVIR